MRFIHISMNSRTLNEFLRLFKPLNEKEKNYPGHQADSGPKQLPPRTVGPGREACRNSRDSPWCWPSPAASRLVSAQSARRRMAERAVTAHLHRAVARVSTVRRWTTVDEVHGLSASDLRLTRQTRPRQQGVSVGARR
jgi:hypothetical protein